MARRGAQLAGADAHVADRAGDREAERVRRALREVPVIAGVERPPVDDRHDDLAAREEDRDRRSAWQRAVRDAEQQRRQRLLAVRLVAVQPRAEERRLRGPVDVDAGDGRRRGRAHAPDQRHAQRDPSAAVRAPADDVAPARLHARAADVAPAAPPVEALQHDPPVARTGHPPADAHDAPDERRRRDDDRTHAGRPVAGGADRRRDDLRDLGAAGALRHGRRRAAARDGRAEHGDERDAIATRPCQLGAYYGLGRRSMNDRTAERPTSNPICASSLAASTVVVTSSWTGEAGSSSRAEGAA